MGGDRVDALAEVVGDLNEMVRFQALTIAELMLVVQYFVRERCDDEPIEAGRLRDLEEQWNRLARQFHEHAEWVKRQNEARLDAE